MNFIKQRTGKNRKLFARSFCEKGAATVELTFALFILLALTLVYWEFVAIFFIQQRVNYATYMGERSNIVDGNASSVVSELNGGGEVNVGQGVSVSNRVNLPVNLNSPWDGRGLVYRVRKNVDMPDEPFESGDN